MPLLSLEELSSELSVSCDSIRDLIARHVIVPYGGRARLGEPRFSTRMLPTIKQVLKQHLAGID
jgi:hypothetical protein